MPLVTAERIKLYFSSLIKISYYEIALDTIGTNADTEAKMITYFVLKATGGKPVGCVRLEDGRARSSCPCTLLLEDGTPLPLGEG